MKVAVFQTGDCGLNYKIGHDVSLKQGFETVLTRESVILDTDSSQEYIRIQNFKWEIYQQRLK